MFAFVVRGAGNAGGARGGRICAGAFPQPAGEVFRMGVGYAGHRCLGLVIAGAGLKRKKSRLPYPNGRLTVGQLRTAFLLIFVHLCVPGVCESRNF